MVLHFLRPGSWTTKSLLVPVTKTMQLLPSGDSPYVSVKDTLCPGYVDTCVVIIFVYNCFASMVYHVV